MSGFPSTVWSSCALHLVEAVWRLCKVKYECCTTGELAVFVNIINNSEKKNSTSLLLNRAFYCFLLYISPPPPALSISLTQSATFYNLFGEKRTFFVLKNWPFSCFKELLFTVVCLEDFASFFTKLHKRDNEEKQDDVLDWPSLKDTWGWFIRGGEGRRSIKSAAVLW